MVMSRKWQLEVQPASDRDDACMIRLVICDPATDTGIEVVPVCHDLEQFKVAIHSLKGELDQMLQSAEARLKELAAVCVQTEMVSLDLGAVWEKIEACGSQQEMFDYFNGFEADARQGIADYIFVHANMFKGWGPVFAEHYNLNSSRLEE
jgi:hypothetical protein